MAKEKDMGNAKQPSPEKKYLDPQRRFYSNGGDTFFNFGKHVSKRCTWHKSYLKWMIKGFNFTQETKDVAKDILANPEKHNIFTGLGLRVREREGMGKRVLPNPGRVIRKKR